MVRVVVPFCSGILTTNYLPVSLWQAAFGLGVCLSFSAGYQLLRPTWQFRLRHACGVVMLVLLFCSGMIALIISRPQSFDNWWGHGRFNTGFVNVKLLEAPRAGRKAMTAVAEFRSVSDSTGLHSVSGKLLVTILRSDSSLLFAAGQVLAIAKLPAPIPFTANPGGFDYRHYMSLQGVTHQIFLVPGEYQALSVERSALNRLLDRLQAYVLKAIRTNIRESREAGLAEALLIGYRNDLDRDLVQSYSNTGVVHVIAISGLHLALVYLLLGKACDLCRIRSRIAKAIVVLGGLWIFALLAGGSPSVVRSAVMFSVIVAGELINRKAHILNSLAASAFFLLCYNPLWLWDLGFQLSYIAVLSLALTATPIYQMAYVRNPLLDNLYKLASVTIAAQILTTPISLYNFHKFPLLFLFTNCICVPLSSIILLGELALCLLYPLPGPASLLGSLLYYGLKFMNDIVRYFEHYPISNFQPVQLNVLQTILLYGFIVCMLISRKQRSMAVNTSAAFMLVLFFVIRIGSFRAADHQSAVVVYNIPGAVLADIYCGRRLRCLSYSGQADAALENRYARSTRILCRVNETSVERLKIVPNQICVFNGLRLLFLESRIMPLTQVRDTIDLVILSHNSLYRSFRGIAGLKVRQVVADGTNSRTAVEAYSRFFHKNGVPFHAVSLQGAFVGNLN